MSVITVLVNAALNITLMNVMRYRGLALGTSMAALFNAIALVVLLRSHLHGLNERRLLGAFARISIASALMGATAFYAHELLQGWLPSPAFAIQALRLGISIGLAVLVLAASAWMLRIREFNEGVAMVVRRFRRTSR